MTSTRQGSLSSTDHAKIDFEKWYADILHLIPTQGVVMDIGGGAGRDGIKIHERAAGELIVFNIEPESEAFLESQKLYPNKTALPRSQEDFITAVKQKQVIFIPRIIQDAKPQHIWNGLKADLAIFNAVLMFIPREQHGQSLEIIFNLMKPGGRGIVRYRTEELKGDMILIDHEILEQQCQNIGFKIERTAQIPDAAGRNIMWHQLLLQRPS